MNFLVALQSVCRCVLLINCQLSVENIPSSSSLHQEKIIITVSLNTWTLFFVVNLIPCSVFQCKVVIEMFSPSAHAQDINFATCIRQLSLCAFFSFYKIKWPLN